MAAVDESPPLMSNGRIKYPDDFERFWALYPKKQQKSAAYREWCRISQRVDKNQLLVAAANFSKDMQTRLVETKYIQNCAKWLNNLTFSDYLDSGTPKPITVWEFDEAMMDDLLEFCANVSSICKTPELGDTESESIKYWVDVVHDIFAPFIHGSEDVNEDTIIMRKVASGEG